MRPSSKVSTLVCILAAVGLLARLPVVSARPFCPSDSSKQSCQDDRVIEHWLSRRGIYHHHPRAFRLPGPKGGPADDAPKAPSPPGSPSGPVKPKPEGDNNPQEFSGPVHGTPWGLSPTPPKPATDADFDLSKIPNIEEKGCTIERSDPSPVFPGEPVFTISLKDKNAPEGPGDMIHLGILRTNKEQGSITVEEAFPQLVNTPHPTGGETGGDRVRLWEMQATVAFHKSGMKPSGIKQLRTVGITEPTSIKAIRTSREKLGLKDGDGFTVKKDSEGTEKEVFELNLNESVFGGNAKTFLKNVPINEKEVKEIRVEDGGLEELTYVFVIG